MLKNMTSIFLIALCALSVTGCTSITVKPVAADAGLKHVCIENNPKVTISNFVPVVQEGFQRHGISTELYSGEKPAGCEYVLTYTALRSWDVTTYLSKAELHLLKDGAEVANAEYHLRGKGGLSFKKWQGVKTKMDPVIDQLLKDYK